MDIEQLTKRDHNPVPRSYLPLIYFGDCMLVNASGYSVFWPSSAAQKSRILFGWTNRLGNSKPHQPINQPNRSTIPSIHRSTIQQARRSASRQAPAARATTIGAWSALSESSISPIPKMKPFETMDRAGVDILVQSLPTILLQLSPRLYLLLKWEHHHYWEAAEADNKPALNLSFSHNEVLPPAALDFHRDGPETLYPSAPTIREKGTP
uniref:Uncharacterized protein n=1 Tax=Coccidioides posadasii RMSCC 3488 TaxID=454284 RepID=A0A0J6IKY2_COCPO|nr:hypothetical protein CPAG_08891 [Coccidioides posadasii RMSCC 3488]